MSSFNTQEFSENPFEQIVDNSCEGILIVIGDHIIYLNKLIKQQLDINMDVDLPANLNEILYQEKYGRLQKIISNFDTHQSKNKNFIFDFQENKYSGKLSAFDAKENAFKILITNCLTEQIISDKAYKENSDSVFPFIETDKTGKISYANKKFLKVLQYSEKNISEGLLLSDIVANANKPVIESLFNNIDKFEDSESIEVKLKIKASNLFSSRLFYKHVYRANIFEGLKCVFIDISENKIIENKYRYNQQRLRKILDLVPQMIFLKDKDGKILMANKSGAEFYNTSAKELVYENISKFHKNTEELEKILSEDRKVIETKTINEWKEKELTGVDGKKQLYNVTKVPYQDNGSDEVFSLGIAQNITQQRIAEIEKEEANEKYRLVVEKGNDGILILINNKIEFANHQAEQIIGKKEPEIIGHPLTCFIPENQLLTILDRHEQDLKNKIGTNYYNLKLAKTSGNFVYLEIALNTITYQGKEAKIVFLRNITKRRLAEKQSEKDRNLLEQAQKIAHLGSWEWDMIKNKLFCSEEIAKILEENSDSQESRDISWLIGFIPISERRKILRGLINTKRSGIKFETDFPVISSSSERKIIHSQTMVYNDSTGKSVSLIGTWLDITDRIKIEQMLKEAKLKAEDSDRLKSAFLANMSHEIRTPMNAVLGFASLLKREDIDEKTRIEYIDHILQSGENLIKLINDIVDISKIESNQLEIEKCPVRINELLEQIYNRYEELLLLKNNMNIQLQYEVAIPDLDFTIISDPYRLQQILSNLINNAIKFTPAGIIKFGYCIANSELMFFVQDHGIGVPEEKKEEIFRRFSKLEDPERINKSGAGLGLSISKSLVDLLGGKIWIDKEIDKGSRFCFTLPLEILKSEKNAQRHKISNELIFDIDLKDRTILIAEDEVLNYRLLETLIKKTGAKVLWAKNGIDAVQQTVDNKIDLIFMDIKMPEMDGYEATKQIKRIDPSIPIIAQTAFAFSNERNYILQSGCDMYMTKPIDHNELYKALKIFLVSKGF